MHVTRAHRRAILALTFATGGAGLIYQVVWQRYLARLLGADGLATATVLAVFLAGLSLGYRAWGRRSLEGAGLLRTYGRLECAIGVWALAFPFTFELVSRLTAGWALQPPWGLALGGTVCSAVLIGPPAFLMGATVPILTRVLTQLLERATRTHSRVYAINTAGAVVGSLATGFFLIHRFGLPGTLRLAALLNLAAGAWFLWLARGGDDPTPRAEEAVAPAPGWRLAAIAGLSGFYFMSFESLWIRFVQLSVGASTFNFALVIAAVILALAVGAWLAGRLATGRPGALFRNQAAALVALTLLFATLDKWPWAAYAIRIRAFEAGLGFAGFHAAVFVALVAVLGIPAGLMGATLPLTFDAAGKNLRSVGRQAGALLGWNALGSLAGGLVGGYLILSALNLAEAYLVALSAVAVSAWIAAAPLARSRVLVATVTTLAAVALAIGFPYDPLRFAVGAFRLRQPIEQDRPGPAAFYESYHRNRTVVAYLDEPDGTFAVVENLTPEQLMIREFPAIAADLFENGVPDAPPALPRSIVVNGKSDSSTYYDRETLRLSAHLPALMGRIPVRSLIVGLGTGVTAGELTLYPEIESIRVVEISPAVGTLLPFFEPAIRGLLTDPRYALIAGDAFRELRRSGESYDAIMSEPSNPWVLGVDQLFSTEFYDLVATRLKPDGVFVQWLQRYATTEEVYTTIVRTLQAEFPYVWAFRGAEHDDLLVASKNPLDPSSLEQVAGLLRSHGDVRRSLAEIGILGRDDLLSRMIPLPHVAAAGPMETLDRPRIHHQSGIAVFRGDTLDDPDPLR